MASYRNPGFFNDKRNQFLSKYAVVCAKENSVVGFNYPDAFYAQDFLADDDWISVFGDGGGIQTFDPFKGKMLKFWSLSNSFKSLTSTSYMFSQFSGPTLTPTKGSFSSPEKGTPGSELIMLSQTKGGGIPMPFFGIGTFGW